MRWMSIALLLAACTSSEEPVGATADDLGAATDSGADTARARSGDPCLNPGTPGATATCLQPTMAPEYYVAQANAYFDTLDTAADPDSMPNYADLVARWEWPPWLLLTGYGRQDMIDTAALLKVGDPSTVPVRDCRFFERQPFARCTVTFEYEGGSCPIYEEFTFNEAGEMTFIEAWSDLPGLRPQQGTDDFWGERPGSIDRLSTRVPGLGHAEGRLELDSPWMQAAAAADPDVADFAQRAADWWAFWYEALAQAPDDFFAQGCGW